MISIVIPCYNSKKYINKNLDSLIYQTNKNFKAIFIDDGSTDDTIYIIKNKLSGTNVNYEIYERQHNGVGAARNYGISMCETPYIMFLDSDDYLDKNCIKNIIDSIEEEKRDIIIGRYNHEYNNKIVWKYENSYMNLKGELSSEHVLKLILDNKAHVCTSNAVYKLELFKNISFNEKCIYHEDLNVFYKIISRSKRIRFLNENMFVYVIRDNSISHDFTVEKLKQGIYMLEELYKSLEDEKVTQDVLKKIKFKTIPNVCYLFFNNLCLENDELINIYKECRYFELMKSANLENYSVRSLVKYIRIKVIGYVPRVYKMFWKIYINKIKHTVRR